MKRDKDLILPILPEPYTKPVGFGSTYLVVCVPAGGRLTSVHWGINLAAQLYPMNMAVDYCSVEGGEVGQSRDLMVEYALDSKAKFMWCLDDDVLPPNYAVQRLYAALQSNQQAMACGGIYYSKTIEPAPVVFERGGEGPFYNWKEGEVFELPSTGFIGTGCLLINMEIFSKISKPWFKTLEYPDKVTDDAHFCRKVQAAGYKILGHGGVLCGHIDLRNNKTIWPKGSVFNEQSDSSKSSLLPIS